MMPKFDETSTMINFQYYLLQYLFQTFDYTTINFYEFYLFKKCCLGSLKVGSKEIF